MGRWGGGSRGERDGEVNQGGVLIRGTRTDLAPKTGTSGLALACPQVYSSDSYLGYECDSPPGGREGPG